jgi:hypothetical protein
VHKRAPRSRLKGRAELRRRKREAQREGRL